MDSFMITQTNQIFNKIEFSKYVIQDHLLSDCIGMGRANSGDYSRVQGFNCGKDFGYALLTYFTSRALNIQRMPFCEDRIYNKFHFLSKYENEILQSINEDRVNEICREICEIYMHTQRSIQLAGLGNVSLRRELKGQYVENLLIRKAASEILGKDYIYLEMDSLNSFGDAGEYIGAVSLQLTIPIKDILYCYKFIDSKHTTSCLVEPGEWVVINRSPTGVVKLPTTRILIRDAAWYNEILNRMDKGSAENYLSQNSPLALRSNY